MEILSSPAISFGGFPAHTRRKTSVSRSLKNPTSTTSGEPPDSDVDIVLVTMALVPEPPPNRGDNFRANCTKTYSIIGLFRAVFHETINSWHPPPPKKPRKSRRLTRVFRRSWTDSERWIRSEEHTSELQSHSFISYAVFCLKKK